MLIRLDAGRYVIRIYGGAVFACVPNSAPPTVPAIGAKFPYSYPDNQNGI